MPPPEHGKALSMAEIAILRRWIDEGAEYEQHWSFKPLVRPPIPKLSLRQPSNPIDAFIREGLAGEKVDRVGPADARTLLRRLSFDLTGLPPDPKLVERFVQESTTEAYSRMVEQFLRSPHYGERMAMYWLDLVRYADTLGYHGDQPRSVSPYRDYVIAAFNSNKPFDQFTLEQLAGDLLPDATVWQKVATTYNRLNRASGEGGVQPKEYLAKYSADRVRTTGAVWLGATLGCAECHDHKFDPFTARDFYRFASFFAEIKEQGIVRSAVHIEQLPVPTREQSQRLDELSREIQAANREFRAKSPELVEAQRRWESEVRADASHWHILEPQNVSSRGGASLTVLKDRSILAGGPNPERDVYTVRGGFDEAIPFGDRIVALRLELLPDKSLPRLGPGRASNGNLVLHAVEMTINDQRVHWTSADASHSQSRPLT